MAKQPKSSTSDPNAVPAVAPVETTTDVNLNADPDHQLMYKGASGEMAVMSEFLYRQINVAVPMVDAGDDVFVVKEKDEAVTRVQVKYSKATDQQNDTYYAAFNLPWEQLDRPDAPPLVYVFAVRRQDHWTDFVVLRRSILRFLQAEHDIGTMSYDAAGEPLGLALRLVFSETDVTAKKGYDLQPYRNAFEPWPPASA